MSFWAYVLRSADGSYHTGHTDDLEARVGAHQAGLVDAYTRSRRPVRLAWAQECPTREEALAAELQIKGWSRAKKEALIRGDWDGVQYLSRKLFLRSPFDTLSVTATQDERALTSDPLILSSGPSGAQGRVSKDERPR